MAKVTIGISRLSNKELSRLVVSLLKEFQDSRVTIEDLVLTKLRTRLAQESEQFVAGLSEVKDKSVKEDMVAADKARDLDLQQLYDMVKLGRYAKTTEEKEAYKKLLPLFKGLTKAKYDNNEEESAFINSLLAQLKQTDYQAHVRSLNLTKVVASLTKSQADFEVLVHAQINKVHAKTVFDSKKYRKSLEETYNRLSDYLYIMSEEHGTVAYQKLYKLYAANSNYFKPLVNQHKPKAKKDTPKAEEPSN